MLSRSNDTLETQNAVQRLHDVELLRLQTVALGPCFHVDRSTSTVSPRLRGLQSDHRDEIISDIQRRFFVGTHGTDKKKLPRLKYAISLTKVSFSGEPSFWFANCTSGPTLVTSPRVSLDFGWVSCYVLPR